MQNGIRFTPAEIIELGGCLTEKVFKEAIRSRRGQFTAEQYEELEGLCFDEDLLEAVAKAGGIRREIEDLPIEPEIAIVQPVRKRPGFLATLLGIASDAGSRRSHPGRCTGDCSNCPAHYGYRYGRWYYGHHHTHGCEFGGNEPGISRTSLVHRNPVGPMPGDRIRLITGNGIGRRRFHHPFFILLGVVPFVELTIHDRTAGTVDLIRSHAFAGKHPCQVRAGQFRGDADYPVILKLTLEQRRDFHH